MKRISILGSTGSIGRSTLDVVESYPDRFQIVALAAGRNLETALEQVRRWKPRVVSVAAEEDAETFRKSLKTSGISGVEVVYGSTGTVRVATHPDADFVVSAIVGVAGLEATYEAVRAGRFETPLNQSFPQSPWSRLWRIQHGRWGAGSPLIQQP